MCMHSKPAMANVSSHKAITCARQQQHSIGFPLCMHSTYVNRSIDCTADCIFVNLHSQYICEQQHWLHCRLHPCQTNEASMVLWGIAFDLDVKVVGWAS